MVFPYMKKEPGSIPEPVCQICGDSCNTWEVVYTGDEESHEGFELWNYCPKCDTDTFHAIKTKV